MAKTRRIKNNGNDILVSVGAVNQHNGSLPLYICNNCGGEVVWCESKRTGRHYLVNVQHGYNDQRFYMGHAIHKCN